MAHVQKYTRTQVGSIFRHCERSTDGVQNRQNIDESRTHLNYNLAPHELSGQEFLEKRLGEVHCSKRADVNVMVSWIVTLPNDVVESEKKRFFESTVDFLNERYGKENCAYAIVHEDERTAHLHYGFVPVVWDEKKQRDKVRAADVINRNELTRFHSDLQAHVSRELGHEVGIITGTTKDNVTLLEYKARKESEHLEELRQEAKVLQNEVDELQEVVKMKAKHKNSENSLLNSVGLMTKQQAEGYISSQTEQLRNTVKLTEEKALDYEFKYKRACIELQKESNRADKLANELSTYKSDSKTMKDIQQVNKLKEENKSLKKQNVEHRKIVDMWIERYEMLNQMIDNALEKINMSNWIPDSIKHYVTSLFNTSNDSNPMHHNEVEYDYESNEIDDLYDIDNF